MSLAEERREDAGCGASPCAIAANDRELEHINAQALSSGVGPLRSVELAALIHERSDFGVGLAGA